MGLRLFWRFASDAGTITPTSTTAGFPVRNLQRATLSSKHKTAAALATESWIVDVGATPVTTSAFFLGGHDFLSGDTLELRHAATLVGVPTGTSIPVTWREGALLEFFTPTTDRFFGLYNTKAVAATTRQAGRLLLGDHLELTYALRLGYGTGGRSDTAKKIRTEGGQQTADLGVALKGQRGTLVVTEAEKVEIETLRATYGTGFPFVSALDYENEPEAKTLYGFFSSLGEPVDTGVDHWTYQWDMVEQK